MSHTALTAHAPRRTTPLQDVALKLTATLQLIGLTACTVGPNYLGPPDAAPQARGSATFKRAGGDKTAGPPLARWWAALNDPVLSDLIERGLHNSPTLQAAEARIRQARATLSTRRAAGLPSATANAAAIRASVPPNSPFTALSGGNSGGGAGGGTAQPSGRESQSFFSVGFDALWELDLFGGLRRGVEGAQARVEAATASFEDAQVQLAAEIGQAYAQLRSQQMQLALARRNEAAQTKLVELTQARSRYGTADSSSIEPARSQLIQARATAVPIPGQLAQSLDRLALLTGQEPGTLDATLTPPAPLPALPAAIEVGDPAAMLRRRPDVRQAERNLASRNAAIGSAVAQRFPSITLFGDVSFSNGLLPKLFQLNSLTALGGPILRWNFLDFGTVQAGIDQATAANDEASANYRSAVLRALQDAESSLSRFAQQQQTLQQSATCRTSQPALTWGLQAGTCCRLVMRGSVLRHAGCPIRMLEASSVVCHNVSKSRQTHLDIGWGAGRCKCRAAAHAQLADLRLEAEGFGDPRLGGLLRRCALLLRLHRSRHLGSRLLPRGSVAADRHLLMLLLRPRGRQLRWRRRRGGRQSRCIPWRLRGCVPRRLRVARVSLVRMRCMVARICWRRLRWGCAICPIVRIVLLVVGCIGCWVILCILTVCWCRGWG